MILTIDVPFDFGQIVYLLTDKEQQPRIVTGVKACPYGDFLIELSCVNTTSWHYTCEISEEKILSMIT
jgi:hypothetical protein